MNILRFFHKNQRKGFTLMETLVTVGIVAVLCAIAIPSIITVNRSMNERDLDNSARAVYLAAQSNLAQMRSSGDLEKLAAMTSDQGARNVPETGNANMGGDWNEQLRHTVSGTSEAFNLVLPANVLDSQLREQQILIEYNPFSGHVYAVFYSEGEQELTYSLIGDRTNEEALKEKGIGYYCGGSVTIAPAEVNSTAVTLSADTDGQELIASVTVPVPETYTSNQDKFYQNIAAELTIHGETSGVKLVIPTDSLSLNKELCIGSPNYVEFTFVLDSLNTVKAFEKLNAELPNGTDTFIPGENLTIAADVQFDAPEGETILTFDEVVITGVNSLFAEMETKADGTYVIELSNGRHLQNLNALSADIAEDVAEIRLVEDIYWNETVEYYTDAYVTPKAARAAEAADFEHFTPVNTSAFTNATVVFDGDEHRVLYLNIDTTGYAGLFSVCNLAQVNNLAIVSPTVKGTQNVGALAGAANRVTFTNCSVYIDTEDKYFSWDKMDEFGVFSTEKDAGGLVGYANNGTFTNCFAAVNVDAAENAGGFVGYSDGADASMCYASGNVTGKTAGGFVGYSEDETYKQCFASGDVYADAIDGVAGGFVGNLADYVENAVTFSECYAVGVVEGKEDGENKATVDGFCGAGLEELDVDKTYENEVYKNTYYLNRNFETSSLCATAASYDKLSSAGENNVPAGEKWGAATEATTHRYTVTGEGVYPFVMLKDMDFYGDWSDETVQVAVAYFENYKVDNDSTTVETGYYINDEKTSTLRSEDMVVELDGYVLLVSDPNATVTVDGHDNTNEPIKARAENNSGTITYKQYNGFYIYDLPTELYGDFYNAVSVNAKVTVNEKETPISCTLYYNPDFALTQLNPVFNEKGEIEEEVKAEGVPSKIYIRTARHLAAIAGNEDYQGSIYNYVQMIDVDFTTYGGTDGYTMKKSIADFAGSYTGAGGYVNQAKIVLKDAVTLFTKITGKVSHVDVVAGDLGTAEAGFVTDNEGEIVNCTVGPSTGNMTIGLTYGFAGTNSGTIRGSMANTGATNAAFVGTNDGTIADCYAWYPGTAADPETKIVFAETDEGEIVSSYAAIYEKLDEENKVEEHAYVLVYDRDGVAAFRDTLKGITLGENWYSYSDAIIEEKGYYPYSTPEGINHRGGWDEFEEYKAFTGYYYYETYEDSTEKGLYIEIIGQDDKAPVNTLKDIVPATTAYGIFTVTPPTRMAEDPLEQTALTLNSAPIVPSELENDENESYISEQILKEFGEGYTCDMLKELSSQSIYVLNGTKINTWFAPANEDGAYRIRTAEQFAAIEEFPGESFIQETDITITAPLTYFEGTYDGGENILRYESEKPLTITLDAANGEEVEIDDGNGGKTTVIRDNVAYGLFANITGENAVIKNCRVVGAIDIKESAEKATAEITAAIGGLVGENHGTIKTSSVEGLKVTHTAATVTEGISYTADITLGGLVGRMADGGVYDSYAAATITSSRATVGAFVGEVENGTFYACHGWNGVNEFVGSVRDGNFAMSRCFFSVKQSDGRYKVYQQMRDDDGSISEATSNNYGDIDKLVKLLNDDRGDIWDTKTTAVDEDGKTVGEPLNVKYPVLAGRHDANAIGDANLYKEPEIDSVKLDAPVATEAPTETAEPETTPETTEQPDVTAEPEATEIPAETSAPEVTPEPTAEPTPVPTETPVVEVAPEPTAEAEPVSEES